MNYSGLNYGLSVLDGTSASYVRFDGTNDRLGVGTVSPSHKVDIADVSRTGTHPSSYALYATKTSVSASDPIIGISHTNGTQAIGVGYSTISAIGSNATQDLILASKSTGVLAFNTNSTERMRIAGDGKVGIGTASPAQLLDVNGTIRGRGSIVNVQTGSASLGAATTYTSGTNAITISYTPRQTTGTVTLVINSVVEQWISGGSGFDSAGFDIYNNTTIVARFYT